MNWATTSDVCHIYDRVKSEWRNSDIVAESKLSVATVYKIINFFKVDERRTIADYFEERKSNRRKCGRKPIVQSVEEIEYCQQKIEEGYAPDIIANGLERKISISKSTFYNRVKEGLYDKKKLPFRGKRRSNGAKESRGSIKDARNISFRSQDFKNYEDEFGHFEGDTIVGANHQSSIVTLAEPISKKIIALKTKSRSSAHTIEAIDQWLSCNPGIVKSIVFDCGKEFAFWKSLAEKHNIAIYFADPGSPCQRGLNENSNALLRRDGLTKSMCFKNITQERIDEIAEKRNSRPRKSLGYKTPNEIFDLEVLKLRNCN